MNVLIAHYDRWTRLVLMDVLTRAGFGVAEASNGSAALRLATLTRPDVVVLGARLSEIAASEVHSALKADPTTRDIGVFVVRGRSQISAQAVAACVSRCQRHARARSAGTRLARPRVGSASASPLVRPFGVRPTASATT